MTANMKMIWKGTSGHERENCNAILEPLFVGLPEIGEIFPLQMERVEKKKDCANDILGPLFQKYNKK